MTKIITDQRSIGQQWQNGPFGKSKESRNGKSRGKRRLGRNEMTARVAPDDDTSPQEGEIRGR